MAKKAENRPGYGKLLDAWVPAEDAGQPIGCMATTFTFSPEFFEEECLTRFLSLESEPSDGPVYLVEREEKLAQLSCASVLVDQHHCRGSRSLRWDLLSARLDGLQHAKISLLVWTNSIRLIIGSANLTEDGYRRNQEVFGVIDFKPEGGAPLRCLQDTVAFLKQLADASNHTDSHTSPLLRWNALLDRALTMAMDGGWGLNEVEAAKAPIRVFALFSGPRYSNVLESLRQLWPNGPAPNLAAVVSPFFDPPEAQNQPVDELWRLLPARGPATVQYHLTAEEVPGEEKVLVHAPQSLDRYSNRSETATSFHALALESGRPLHAKSIWFENDRWAVYMTGSSNFTSRGLGLSSKPNSEANLVYLIDGNRHPLAYNELQACFPESREIEQEIVFRPVPNEDEDKAGEFELLPAEFADATFELAEDGQGRITLHIAGQPPAGWQLVTENEEPYLNEAAWDALGRPETVQRAWSGPRAPSGFMVRWTGATGSAWLPVNVRSSEALPPPDELKNLPLDVLINILSSARPLHRVLGEYLRKRARENGHAQEMACVIDPHKRVDTTQFLLQRTRRVSWALNALRERLEQPAATLDSLRWRLYGPVGVRTFADALVREAKSEEEKAFLISELALELARAKPTSRERCIPPEQQVAEIKSVIAQLKALVPPNPDGAQTNLRQYVDSVFALVAP